MPNKVCKWCKDTGRIDSKWPGFSCSIECKHCVGSLPSSSPNESITDEQKQMAVIASCSNIKVCEWKGGVGLADGTRSGWPLLGMGGNVRAAFDDAYEKLTSRRIPPAPIAAKDESFDGGDPIPNTGTAKTSAERVAEQLAGELGEAVVIIHGFLTIPAMTMDQRKEMIADARKFLTKLGL